MYSGVLLSHAESTEHCGTGFPKTIQWNLDYTDEG